MKNADMPVMPLVNENGHPFHISDVAFENKPLTSGLTKREMFAMTAMQGLLADSNMQMIAAVNLAVECADLLLRKLDGEDINLPVIPNPDWPEMMGENHAND